MTSIEELKLRYGPRDEKEGAIKEFTILLLYTKLAHKNFVRYAERFRALGSITGFDNELLIDA